MYYLMGCVATVITLFVYLGVYAFNNPEAQAYYIAGTDETQPDLVAFVPDIKADFSTPNSRPIRYLVPLEVCQSVAHFQFILRCPRACDDCRYIRKAWSNLQLGLLVKLFLLCAYVLHHGRILEIQ